VTEPMNLPPQAFLQECFDYSPETGDLTWRHRPRVHFHTEDVQRYWNSRFAGQRVAYCDNSGYRTISLRYRYRSGPWYAKRDITVQAHRLIWKLVTGQTPPAQIDHRNLDRADNRWENLRAATPIENGRNRPGDTQRDLPKGVYRSSAGRLFAAAGVSGKSYYLGRFDTPAEAHEAWCAWARPIHGEFFNPGPEKPSIFD
jgi:hypothetical protein